MENTTTLHASASSPRLELNAALEIQGARIPKAGDNIEISFDDGPVAYAAVVFLNAYDFPIIQIRGERFVLVPAGRRGDLTSEESAGTRWLVAKYE